MMSDAAEERARLERLVAEMRGTLGEDLGEPAAGVDREGVEFGEDVPFGEAFLERLDLQIGRRRIEHLDVVRSLVARGQHGAIAIAERGRRVTGRVLATGTAPRDVPPDQAMMKC